MSKSLEIGDSMRYSESWTLESWNVTCDIIHFLSIANNGAEYFATGFPLLADLIANPVRSTLEFQS
jgi:hypothetical protein